MNKLVVAACRRSGMKKLMAGVCLAASVLIGPLAWAQQGDAVNKAQEAAKAWLALVDAGKYGESWDTASPLLKAALTRTAWEQAAKSARGQLGAVKSRKLQSATYTRSLPGAPEGEYVVIVYAAEFASRPAVETITPMRDKDGAWRVSG